MAQLTTSYQLIAEKTNTYISSGNSTVVFERVYAKYSAQSIAENKSTVQIKVTYGISSGYHNTITNDNSYPFSLVANGQTLLSGNHSLGTVTRTEETLFGEYSFTIIHSDDGTGALSGTYSGVIYNAPSGTATISFSLSIAATLPTIARKSIITALSAVQGVEAGVVATITKYASSFYHKLELKLGNTVFKTVNGYESGNSVSLSDAELVSFYRLLGIAKQGSVTAVLTTYTSSGMGTQIGTSDLSASLTSPGNIRIKKNNEWKQGKAFIKVSGAWKPCVVETKVAGAWVKGK